jgi:hypothetical protein
MPSIRRLPLDRELIEGHPEDHAIRGHMARVLVNLGASLDPAIRRADIEGAYDRAMKMFLAIRLRKPGKEQIGS